MTIPETLAAEWAITTRERENHSRKSWAIAFAQLCQLRDLLTENTLPNGATRVPIMQIYDDAAELLEYSPHTIRKYVKAIRAYESWKLREWAEAGVTMQHLYTANDLDDGKTPPRTLIDRAIELGGTNGGRIMCPDEMLAFALGSETKYHSESDPKVERPFGFLLRLADSLGDRAGEFRQDVAELRRKYFDY